MLTEDRIGRKYKCIRTFCDHINVHIFDQNCIVLKSGSSSTMICVLLKYCCRCCCSALLYCCCCCCCGSSAAVSCCCSSSCAGWCWFIESDPSFFFLFIQTRLIFEVPLGGTVSHLRSRFAYSTSSVIAGMRGAKAGVIPPRGRPPRILYVVEH